MDVHKLKMMAENIANNCRCTNAVQHKTKIAEHLHMFWTPTMRTQLLCAYQQQDLALDETIVQALIEVSPK